MNEIHTSDLQAMADGLNILLDGQYELQVEAYGVDPTDLGDNDRANFLAWNAYALVDELSEAMAEVGWKPWASSRHINQSAFAKELVDLLHFFANLCLATGVKGEHLAFAYAEKRERNLERQQEGYDGVRDKCPSCHRDWKEIGDVHDCLAEAELPDDGDIGFSMNDHGDGG